ncbi:MAG: hypothetical protein IKI35_03125 [Stomatobaculum sp.]|nr:hypothetical protein [Stomatobaculum sp.]
MKEIRHRNVDEIMDEIREKARSYTPEWRLDRKDPDIGTALAEVYAGIQSGLDRKYALLPEKLKIDYFNCLNVSMRSAVPAEGYAVFELAGEEMEGSMLPAGTLLRADEEDDLGNPVPVELKEDIFVVPNTLDTIIETRGDRDYIGLLYDTEMEETGGFPLFGMSADNQEHHVFYLSHPWIFRIRNHGSIVLGFFDMDGKPLPENQLSRFTDSGAVRFFYETGEEMVEYLTEVTLKNDRLWIKKTAEHDLWEETEHAGVTGFWLGCEILDARGLESFSPFRISLGMECPAARPDTVFSVGADQPVDEPMFAFGERFSVYDELYIGAGDAFSKKGADIELSFEEEFARIPVDTEEDEGFNWKLIMPKEALKAEKEYDITIEEVIWEYYNGSGWARLFPGHEYRDLFSTARGTSRQLKKIRFTCPDDLSMILTGSGEGYYIRARILKVNNAFRTAGQYISPVISDISVSCRLDDKGNEPEYGFAVNQLEEDLFSVKRERLSGRSMCLVRTSADRRPAMYFGFRQPPMEGPVRLLWEMRQTLDEGLPEISWEYLKDGGFSPLRPADGTENFRMTGTVTFSGIPDAVKHRMFGRDLYWIRAVRAGRGSSGKETPEILGWYLNGAGICTLRHGITEYWTMENWEDGAEIQLLNQNIFKLELWVREDERLPRDETEALQAEGRYREVTDENGGRSGSWIRWKRTDSLRKHGPGARVYLLNENEGKLTFGGGAHGKVPAPGVNEGIFVEYSVGGGSRSCLPAGTVTGLELTEGYVSTVFNPMPLYGACDRETVQGAMKRAAAERKNRFRAVTEQDFEQLALGAARSLRKARCFSCVGADGQREPGAVTLVLLAEDYMDRGAGFEGMKKRLYTWFEDKLPASLHTGEEFRIREPELIELSLQIDAEIRDYQELYRIQKSLQERIAGFLDPIRGNFNGKGWEIGELPERFQLESLIRSTEGIEGLNRLVVLAKRLKRSGCPSVDFEKVRQEAFVLPVNGTHGIRLQRR